MRIKHNRLAVVVLAITLTACTAKVKPTPSTPTDPVLDSLAVHLNEVAHGAKAVRQVKEALLADGKITKEQSHALTLALIKIDQVGKEMNAKLKGYSTFNAGAKADLLHLFTDLESGYRNLTANGTFASNPQVTGVLKILDAGLIGLGAFFK